MSEHAILHGHVLDLLRTLPAGLARCVVTSPPFWGLRAYGTEPQVWLAPETLLAIDHVHEWDAPLPAVHRGPGNKGVSRTSGLTNPKYHAEKPCKTPNAGSFCYICGAWRGELGLEPSPDLFVEHVVWIFRELRRVLTNDGTCWVEIGDSYIGDGGSARGGRSGPGVRQRGTVPTDVRVAKRRRRRDLKNKDLALIPERLALALQADGWYVRSRVTWNKPNVIPESAKDRPTVCDSRVWMLSKREVYYYDWKAIAEPSSENTHPRMSMTAVSSWAEGPGTHSPIEHAKERAQRGRGNSSFQRSMRAAREIRNKRTVWTIPTKGYEGNHYATFPEALVEPCILAGSQKGDTVLDPFCGSGTVGVVALRHGRRFVGLELLADYVTQARRRIAGPLFLEKV